MKKEKMKENSYIPLSVPTPITEQNWPEGTQPLVHTRTMAFMHEEYIRQCIDGILMQKTTFPVQVLIHEDASSDKTVEILKEYEQKYPRLIRVFFQRENSYTQPDKHERRSEFMSWCSSKYEALCEGDDYWSDPMKLQKQISFLEVNPDFVMSFHAVEILKDKKIDRSNYPIPKSDVLEFNDILYKNYIPTCSFVFKKKCLPDPMPNWVKKCVMGDLPRFLLVGNQGKIKYFPEKMGVYRKHEKGITANPDQKKKGRESLLIMYKGLRRDLGRDRYFPLTLMILKMHLGKLKDFLGLNPSLK